MSGIGITSVNLFLYTPRNPFSVINPADPLKEKDKVSAAFVTADPSALGICPLSAGGNYYLNDQSCAGLDAKWYTVSGENWKYTNFKVETNYARMLPSFEKKPLLGVITDIGVGATLRVHGEIFTEDQVSSTSRMSYGGDLAFLFKMPKNLATIGFIDVGSDFAESKEANGDKDKLPTGLLAQDEFLFSYGMGNGEGKIIANLEYGFNEKTVTDVNLGVDGSWFKGMLHGKAGINWNGALNPIVGLGFNTVVLAHPLSIDVTCKLASLTPVIGSYISYGFGKIQSSALPVKAETGKDAKVVK
jgi:hypothetical protein